MHSSIFRAVSRWLGVLLWLGMMHPASAAPDASTPPAPAALTDVQLRKLLSGVAAHKGPSEDWGHEVYQQLALVAPHGVIVRATREQPEPEHVLAALSKQYGLNPAAARDLLSAQFLATPPRDHWWTRTPEEIRTALALYLDAARQSPESRQLMLLAMLDISPVPTPLEAEVQARVLELLDSAPDPVEQALSLARLRGSLKDWGISFAALAVSRKPDSLPRALKAFDTQREGRDATLFYLAAYQALRARAAEPFPSELAERLMRNLMQEGMPSHALQVFQQLPAAQRKELLTGASLRTIPAKDPRLDLAAALLFLGRAPEARVWRDATLSAQPSPPNEPISARECELPRKRDALAAHLEPVAGADPFPLLVLMEGCSEEAPNHPWGLLLNSALQTVYPESARENLRSMVEREQAVSKLPHPLPLRDSLSFLDEAQRQMEAGDRERLTSLQAALAAVPAPAAASSPEQADLMAPRIRALLEAPGASPFSEHPLSKAPQLKPATRWAFPKNASSFPHGFYPLRAERSGKRVLVLALSQRLDPTGEVSGGGYWLLESRDEGHTWGAPLYTGLRQYRPYELAEKSSLPMLDGDTLRLETSVRELDEQHITFPPISLGTKREKKDLYLEASLSALRKDSDGDGLTDLVEERLLTDPQAADTDGDGLSDEEDPLPQIPSNPTRAASARALLLSGVLAELRGGEGVMPGLEVGLPPPGAPPDEPRLPKRNTPESQDDVVFLEMERGALVGAQMFTHTIVLSKEEWLQAQKRFGTFYPLRIRILINVKGDDALIDWDEHWRGGSYRAHLENGHWVLESKGSWIT